MQRFKRKPQEKAGFEKLEKKKIPEAD